MRAALSAAPLWLKHHFAGQQLRGALQKDAQVSMEVKLLKRCPAWELGSSSTALSAASLLPSCHFTAQQLRTVDGGAEKAQVSCRLDKKLLVALSSMWAWCLTHVDQTLLETEGSACHQRSGGGHRAINPCLQWVEENQGLRETWAFSALTDGSSSNKAGPNSRKFSGWL